MYRRHSPGYRQSLALRASQRRPTFSLQKVPLFLFAVFVSVSLSVHAAGSYLPGLNDGLSEEVYERLEDCSDAYQRLQFKDAEDIAEALIRKYPEHPLPKIYMQATLFAEIQEMLEARLDDIPLLARFNLASDSVILAGRRREAINPNDALAKFYVGSSLGAKGVVLLYQHHYLDAYADGQEAYRELKDAIRLEPRLWDADLGLGTFEYESAQLAGLLRFVLHIHGDEAGGLARLRLCAAGNGICALPAAMSLARIYCFETVDYAKAVPYVREIYLRYPENYVPAREVMALVKGLGLANPDVRCLAEELSNYWHSGWRAPDYARFDASGLGPALAATYLEDGNRQMAQSYLIAASDPSHNGELAATP
jgi:hypothetical protein